MSQKLSAVQVLRAMAASAVVFHHFARIFNGTHSSFLVKWGVGELGRSGVDVFFVISGFIMVRTTQKKSGIADAGRFLTKRVERIYPLYFFWTSILLMLWIAHVIRLGHYSVWHLVSSFLLVPSSNGHSYYPFLAPGWTLEFEMLFYFAFAAVLLIRRRLARLPVLCLLFALLSLGGHLLPECGIRYLLTNPIITEFLYGAVVAEMAILLQGSVSIWACVGLISVGGAGLVSTLLSTNVDAHRYIYFGIPASFIVAGAAMLPANLHCPEELVWLGDASYSIYLFHYFFALAFASAFTHIALLRKGYADLMILVMTAVTIWITARSFDIVERPLNDYIQRLFGKPGASGLIYSVSGSEFPLTPGR